jgi:predicted O-methyltransferase YrrM
VSAKRSAAVWAAISDFSDGYPEVAEYELAAREFAKGSSVVPVARGVSGFLTLLVKLIGAKHVVEVGTGAGVTTTALIKGLDDTGMVTSIDPDSGLQQGLKDLLKEHGVPARKARLIAGQPLDVLEKLTDAGYDLVLISGDPLEYVEYVAAAQKLLRPGGVFVLNNIFWGGSTVDEDNDEDEPLIIREAIAAAANIDGATSTLLPVGDGLLVVQLAAE